MDLEQTAHVVPEGKVAHRFFARPVLRPDQKDRGTRCILPANDQVRPELTEIEVWILERIIGRPVDVFIDLIFFIIRVVRDFFAGKDMEPIRIDRGPGLRNLL